MSFKEYIDNYSTSINEKSAVTDLIDELEATGANYKTILGATLNVIVVNDEYTIIVDKSSKNIKIVDSSFKDVKSGKNVKDVMNFLQGKI